MDSESFNQDIDTFRRSIISFSQAVKTLDDSLAAFMATTETQIDRLESAAEKFNVSLQQLSEATRSRVPEPNADNSRFVRSGVVSERSIPTVEIGSGGVSIVGLVNVVGKTQPEGPTAGGNPDSTPEG